MPEPSGHLFWGAVLVAVPVTLVTVCVIVIALAALVARRPATRRHCLSVMAQLTQYLHALRARR